MKKLYFLIFMVLLLAGFINNNDSHYKKIENKSFTTGELLEYRIHYGMINAAVASLSVSENVFFINNRPCYKIDIHGKSVGLFDLVSRINNNYGSYLDTSAIVPHKFYRYIEEGKYRHNEVVDFDHIKDEATTAKLDKKTKKTLERRNQTVPDNIQDMVSGFYFLRTMDFSKTKKGEIITINSFYNGEVYDFKIRFIGREEIKTKIGNFNTIVFSPIMPENKLFDGENSIKMWISDDNNKIPIKIKASMFIGAVEIDIKSYTNARN
ncbi:MAG: DUF3108 domain-containing protein [Bacteroidota bacterium]|nr:DUF3108 domain-containing protein [Bacteroidota bacterium]